MDFYEDLKTMTDEDIEKYLSYAISNLEKISKLNNNDNDVIGYDVSYNPTDYNLLDTQPKEAFDVDSVNIYSGYVPKNTRVVYALATDLKGNGIFSNEGRYYIVDDDSYIYEFCKYVREYSLDTEGDLFQCISLFLKEYLGGIMNRSRDQMFQMILKSNMLYCEPINEHKLSSFKHEGNAMCSEYAIMANNILSVFGFDSYVIMGDIKQNGEVGGHAFNFVSCPMERLVEDGEGMRVSQLLRLPLFWLLLLLMICSGASEISMLQWASAFTESALGVSKMIGDLAGPCMFAVFMGLARVFHGKANEKLDLTKMMLMSGTLCAICYLMASLATVPVIGLIGCALCGLSVGIMWPGTLSISAQKCPAGGTAMFAFLALAGDLGGSIGPSIVGMVSDLAGGNLKIGLLVATLFPIVLILGLFILNKSLN